MRRLQLLVFILFPIAMFGQNTADTLAKDNVMIPLPTVSVNVGFNHAFTDVSLNDGPSPFRQLGYQLTITQQVAKFLNAGFELYTGSIYGEEQRGLVNLNYRTSIVSPRINLEYNFYPLLKPNANGIQLIRPYVGFGLGMVFFRSKGDLKDANGNEYQYWSNGGIYAEVEGTADVTEATSLERDFVYETDLRDANLDGFRKYSQMAFTLPINAGVRFQISKNVGVNAAFAYALNVTDLIDNVNNESVGSRQGSSGFDNHLFGSVGLSVFLGRTKPSAKPEPRFNEMLADEDSSEESIESSDSENQLAEIMPYAIERTVEDPLATMSKRLIEASTSFEELTNQSSELVSQSNAQLQEIGDRQFGSKKDLRDAKKESIEILEKSIAKLIETNTELNDAASKLNMAYSDISAESINTTTTGTEKIESTVETAIPAVESLKEKVKAAKSPEELKSLMNIASKNLSHTNNIFSEESQKMNSSISEARKTVVKKRTDILLMNTKDIQSLASSNPEDVKAQLTQIEAELQILQSEGTITEEEFAQLKNNLDESLATIESVANNQNAISSEESLKTISTEQTELADAANQLAEVSRIINQSNEEARTALSKTSEQLGLIASKDLSTKEELKAAKQQALEMLESSLAALNQTSAKISEAGKGITKASASLDKNDVEEALVTTDAISSSVGNTSNFIESSKSQISKSNTAEEIKSILNLASSSIDRTLDVVDAESSKINSSILQARKAVIQTKVKELAVVKEATVGGVSKEDELTIPENQTIFKQELETLQSQGLISTEEFVDLSNALDENAQVIERKKLARQTISKDARLKEIPSKVNAITTEVESISKQQSNTVEEKVLAVQNLKNDISSANKKKEVKSVQASLQAELESAADLFVETEKKLKRELVELKSVELDNAAIAQKVQIIEKAIEENSKPLEKLGSISMKVANSSEQTELSEAASEFVNLLKESKSSSAQVFETIGVEDDLIKAQILEARIDNLSKAQEESDITKFNAIVQAQEEISQEIADMEAEEKMNSAEAAALAEKLNSLGGLELASSSTPRSTVNETSSSSNEPQNVRESSSSNKPISRERNIENIENTSPKKTGGYHWADLNKNEWISPDEVLYFIDLLFEGEAERSVEDIQNLIDYYFDQE